MIRMLLLSIALSACGMQEYEILTIEQVRYVYTYTCPTGDTVTIDDEPTRAMGELHTTAEACLGLRCSSDVSTVGDPRCADTTTNPLLGTCVESFFACFQVSGSCSEAPNETTFSNGARITGTHTERGGFFPSGHDQPCILYQQDPAMTLQWQYGIVL